MPPGDEYHVGGGRLKLKGSKVTDGRIEKKKKKKSKEKKAAEAGDQDQGQNTSGAEREPEYDSERKNEGEESALARREGEGSDAQREGDSGGEMVGKTEAERKYEEQRKKRVCLFLFTCFFPTI